MRFLSLRSDTVIAVLLAIAFLLTCAVTANAADAQGKLKSVTADRQEVVMIDDAGTTWTVTAARDCKVHVNDKESRLEDLKAGDRVTITYEKAGEKLVAKAIRATRR